MDHDLPSTSINVYLDIPYHFASPPPPDDPDL